MKEKIQIALNNLKSNFDKKDYEKYLSGEFTRNEMCLKYGCTDYVLQLFFKQNNLLSKRTLLYNNIKEDFFTKIDSPIKAYILGFYIADGYVHKDLICFSISDKDIEILEYIKNNISPCSNIIHIKEYINKSGIKSNPLVNISIPSKRIVNDLVSYGFGYDKTNLIKSIQNVIPKKYMWDFIRGYFDGDGCVSASKVSHIIKGKTYFNWNVNWTIISKDKNILEEILNFIQSEGINVIIYSEKRGNWLMGTHSIKNLPKIYNKLYNGEFCLKRKQNKFKEIIANTEITSKNKKLEVS